MLFKNTKDFYRSNKWESFRKVVIAKRTHEDGFIYCDLCGEPIVKKYDLVLHHKQALSDANINDYNISLNEDNIEVLHFRCHNKVHDRFQGGNPTQVHAGYKMPEKHVYIVYGAPCAGKSSWVQENATADDLIVDMDSIWQMISINDRYTKPAALKGTVFDIRDHMYDLIKHRSGRWHTAFIITGGALKGDRERLKMRTGADDFIFIDTSKEDCMHRLVQRQQANDQIVLWSMLIDEWFERFQAD